MSLAAAEQWAVCDGCSGSVLRHKTPGGADMALIVPERCSDCDAAFDVGSVLNPPLGVQRLEQQPNGAVRDLQRLEGRRCTCQQDIMSQTAMSKHLLGLARDRMVVREAIGAGKRSPVMFVLSGTSTSRAGPGNPAMQSSTLLFPEPAL